MSLEAVKVPAEIVLPLRHAVLRTGRPWADAIYPGDDDPRSAHFAVMDGTTLLAVGSVLPETPDWAVDTTGAWRVRGMATRGDRRGSGLGSKVLGGLVSHVGQHEGGLLWCSARVQAVGLYENFGLVARGSTYMVPGLGEHVTMSTEVGARGPA